MATRGAKKNALKSVRGFLKFVRRAFRLDKTHIRKMHFTEGFFRRTNGAGQLQNEKAHSVREVSDFLRSSGGGRPRNI